MSKIFVFSMGCASRQLDGERYKKFFITNGHKIIDQPDEADYILVNTCAFRKQEENRSIDKIKEFHRRKKEGAQIIVCGCLPGINKQRLIEIFDGEHFTPQNSNKLDDLFSAKIRLDSIADSNKFELTRVKSALDLLKTVWATNKSELLKKITNYIKAKVTMKQRELNSREKFFIRISNGCLGNCSYCGIKLAIGKLKSKPIELITREFLDGINHGYKKFVLTSDDSGAYGLDIGLNFPELLKKLAQISNDVELEIEELNARWLVQYQDELINILKKQKITNFWVAIQSGSDKILMMMNRPGKGGINSIVNCIKNIKQNIPKLQIKAQYIVGFPGETEEDASATTKSIIDSNLDAVNLFKFDPKPSTEAAYLPDQLTEKQKNKRIKIMKKSLKKHGVEVFTNN